MGLLLSKLVIDIVNLATLVEELVILGETFQLFLLDI